MERIRGGWLVALCALLLSVPAIAGPNMFDVSDLANGESRDFIAGTKHLKATRSGDQVTIARLDNDEMDDVVCNLATDTCKIGVNGEHVMLSISQERNCEGDDCAPHGDPNVWIQDGGANVLLERIINCEGDDCPAGTLHGANHMVFRHRGAPCEGDDCPVVEIVTNCEGDDCPHQWVSADGNVHALDGSGMAMFIASDCDGDDCEDLAFGPDGELSSEKLREIMVNIDPALAGPDVFMLRPHGNDMQWKGADEFDGCPEGFRTMRYTDESTEDGYLCIRRGPHAGNSMRPRVIKIQSVQGRDN